MKTKILDISIALLLAGTMLSSCMSSKEKDNNAREMHDAIVAFNEANPENTDSMNGSLLEFRAEAEAKIIDNEKSIVIIKTKILTSNKRNRAMFEHTIQELQDKNSALKIKLVDFKTDEAVLWDTFITEFNSELNELGNELKVFTVSN